MKIIVVLMLLLSICTPVYGSYFTQDTSITAAKIAPRPTGTSVAAGGIAVSAASGTYSNATSTPSDITNLSVTITTLGRPVRIEMVPVGSSSVYSTVTAFYTSGAGVLAEVYFFRASSALSKQVGAQSSSGSVNGSGNLFYDDFPAAGTYTYKVQGAAAGGSGQIVVQNMRLVAYEL